jgi:threonine dehydrogenase-like Zn-dependent dehydrogenase
MGVADSLDTQAQGLGPVGQCAIRWALIKGASRVIGIDRVADRLVFAEKCGAYTIDFSQYTDVPARVREIVPEGLDVAIDCGSFHEPKTMLHKIQKALMMETDIPETVNEALVSVKKLGRVGIIAAYAGFTNGFNIGALMEKGIRLIGNGQGKQDIST